MVIGCPVDELQLAVKLSVRLALPRRHILFRLTNQRRRAGKPKADLHISGLLCARAQSLIVGTTLLADSVSSQCGQFSTPGNLERRKTTFDFYGAKHRCTDPRYEHVTVSRVVVT